MLIEQLPRDSALVRAQLGADRAEWDLTPMLLAAIADALHVANWQRAGNKKNPKPKQIPRPGVASAPVERFGNARHTVTEMRLILDTWSEEDD